MKEHIQDVTKAAAVNGFALGLSLTDMEILVRIFVGLAALTYTIIKIVQALKHKREDDE